MTDDQLKTFQTLDAKRGALIACLQALHKQENEDNQGDVDPEIQRGNLELQLLDAMISELLNDAPIAVPSDADVAAIEAAIAKLQAALTNSNDIAALIAAGDGLIHAWPGLPAGGA